MNTQAIRTLLIASDLGFARAVHEQLSALKAPAYLVQPRPHARDLCSAIENEEQDVILFDLATKDSPSLPEFFDLVGQGKAGRVPVIAFVESAQEERGLKAIRAGADDFLVKGSFDPAQLAWRIRAAIARNRHRAVELRDIAPADPAAGSKVSVSPESVRAQLEHAVIRILADAGSLDAATPQLLAAICRIAGCELGALWRVQTSAEVLRCVAVWHAETLPAGDFETATRNYAFPPGVALPGMIWASGNPHWIEDISQVSNFPRARFALAEGFRAGFGFPVKLGGRVLGVMEFFSREERPRDPELEGTVAELGCRIGEFIERRRTAEVIVEERNLLRTLIDALPDAVYVKDVESRFLIGNTTVAQWMGAADSAELEGKTDFEYYPKELAQRYFSDEQQILKTGEPLINHEEPLQDKSGRQRWLLTTKVPLRDSAGTLIGLVGIGRDITAQAQSNAERRRGEEALRAALADVKRSHQELKATQLQLIQTAKLESVGTLAAGVAHEVKNPLQIILMGVDYLTKNYQTAAENIPGVLEDMRSAIARADRIVRGLLEFSAAYRPEVKDEDLNTIIESALALVRFEIGKSRVEVTRALAEDLPSLKLDKTKIQQVFINLFMNALHSMPQGGTLTVGTYVRRLMDIDYDVGDRTIGRLRVGETVAFPVGDMAVVAEIEDTGRGIPEDKLAKIFDPFYTTKPAGQGTGLGLTVVKKIVELHGGSIDIRNRPDGGVIATVVFKTWRRDEPKTNPGGGR